MFAPGIAPGLTPGGSFGPAQLAAQLQAICGASLIGLWIGDDIILSGSNVASWPARIGQNLTYDTGSTACGVSVVAGRQVLLGTQRSTLVALKASLAAPLAFMMAGSIAALPFPDYSSAITIVNNTADPNVLIGGSGSSHIFGSGKWNSHYVNNVATVNVTTDFSTFTGETGTSGGDNINVAGSGAAGFGRNWLGTIGTVLAVNVGFTTAVRTACHLALTSYY